MTLRGILIQEEELWERDRGAGSRSGSATCYESSGVLIDRLSSFLTYEEHMK